MTVKTLRKHIHAGGLVCVCVCVGGEVKGGRRGLKTAEIILAESCRKQVSFESGFKQRKGRRISEAGWQRVPDRRCKKAQGTLSERFDVALWDFQELFTR